MFQTKISLQAESKLFMAMHADAGFQGNACIVVGQLGDATHESIRMANDNNNKIIGMSSIVRATGAIVEIMLPPKFPVVVIMQASIRPPSPLMQQMPWGIKMWLTWCPRKGLNLRKGGTCLLHNQKCGQSRNWNLRKWERCLRHKQK